MRPCDVDGRTIVRAYQPLSTAYMAEDEQQQLETPSSFTHSFNLSVTVPSRLARADQELSVKLTPVFAAGSHEPAASERAPSSMRPRSNERQRFERVPGKDQMSEVQQVSGFQFVSLALHSP